MKKMGFDTLRNYTYNLERLQKIATALHHIDEAACNGSLTKRQESRKVNLKKEAQEIASMYGLIAYHQGDPRGCSLYLITKEIQASNQYPQGIAIY